MQQLDSAVSKEALIISLRPCIYCLSNIIWSFLVQNGQVPLLTVQVVKIMRPVPQATPNISQIVWMDKVASQSASPVCLSTFTESNIWFIWAILTRWFRIEKHVLYRSHSLPELLMVCLFNSALIDPGSDKKKNRTTRAHTILAPFTCNTGCPAGKQIVAESYIDHDSQSPCWHNTASYFWYVSSKIPLDDLSSSI